MFNQTESQLILEALDKNCGGLAKAKVALDIVAKLQQALQETQEEVQAPATVDAELVDPE